MIAWLGHSHSGDVWQADDLVLQTPVALKIFRSDTPADRERILAEVRLARQITHPAVRRVFDVTEVDGRAFCTMELIQGEDLGALLRRVGRLPSEKVREIGIHLADALAVAHAAGVRHGDVSLENILIGDDGFVRLTDFGIGTSAGPFSESEDLRALGAVLYHLLVGQRPKSSRWRQKKPSAVVPDVDEQLERAVLGVLDPSPHRRPASAAALREQLRGVEPVGETSHTPAWVASAVGVVVALIVAAVAVVPYFRSASAGAVLSDQDTIVLADVLNTTGDQVFDRALRVALAVALEQSPFLKMVPEERIRETLQLMQLPANAPVTRAVAREVARREQAKALVSASIGSLGANYVISLEAVEAATGEVMAREQTEARGKEAVLTALGEAAARLRGRLGDSLALVDRFDVPLARATTPSLEALQAYSQALDQGRLNPRAEAIPYLVRAIEFDPDFAMAHGLLSAVYMNMGRFADAPAHSRRAYELRDRVSERERFFISWRYYLDAAQDWDEALTLAESWTATYPREAFAFNSLALATGAFGDHERAVAALREAIRLDPNFVPPYANLVGRLIAQGQFDEAKIALDVATARGIDITGTRRGAFYLSLLGVPGVHAIPDPDWTFTLEARAAAAAGRFAVAEALYERAVGRALAGNLRDLAAQWSMEAAELHALAGDCPATRERVNTGLGYGRDNFTLERASRAMALCGDSAGAEGLTMELSKRYPAATLTQRVQIPISMAALSLWRGDDERTLTLLDAVRPYDHAPAAEFWSKYLRGQAFVRSRNSGAAGEQFEMIIRHRGEAPTSPLFALAHLGLARAHAAGANIEAAKDAYARFLTLWGDADSQLHFLADARRESDRLSSTLESSP
jgi:tetratricopeptide (TPR) repeat protein